MPNKEEEDIEAMPVQDTDLNNPDEVATTIKLPSPPQDWQSQLSGSPCQTSPNEESGLD